MKTYGDTLFEEACKLNKTIEVCCSTVQQRQQQSRQNETAAISHIQKLARLTTGALYKVTV